MTAIGHFSVASETAWNPSIITFAMKLNNTNKNTAGDTTNVHNNGLNPSSSSSLTALEFQTLWLAKDMPQLHPRFHQTLVRNRNGSGWHFEEDRTISSNSSSSSNDSSGDSSLAQIQKHVTDTVFPVNRLDLIRRLQSMQMERWDLADSLWHVALAGESPFPSQTTPYKTRLMRMMMTSPDEPSSPSQHQTSTWLFFRGHHALADGASIGAALADLFDEAPELRRRTAQAVAAVRVRRRRHGKQRGLWYRWCRFWQRLVRFCLGSLQAMGHQSLLFWHQWLDDNPWQQLEQQVAAQQQEQLLAESSVTQHHPAHSQPNVRTLSYSEVAPIEQVKWVAETLSKRTGEGSNVEKEKTKETGPKRRSSSSTITVNDVFVSCVTAALARQLSHHRTRLVETQSASSSSGTPPEPLALQKHMHVAVPVHLKGGVILPGESVGNNLGAFVVRVPGETTDDEMLSRTDSSIARLRAVSQSLHSIKQTPAALLSHILAKSLSLATAILPVSWISKMYSASNAGSLVVVSNNRGPPMPVHLAGRQIESIYGFVPLPPGIPVGVVVMSYAGNVNCTVSAEPWAVPDGDQFMVWVLEEYMELVKAASATGKSRE